MTLYKRLVTFLVSNTPFILATVLTIFLHLSRATATHKTTNRVTTYPSYQHLNIRHAIASTRLHHSSRSSATHKPKNNEQQTSISLSQNIDDNNSKSYQNSSNNISLKLRVIHRDKLKASNNEHYNHRERLFRRVQRDVKSVSTLVRKLSNITTAAIYDYKVQSFGTDVVSGMDQGSGEYFIQIGVGSPPKKQYMVIDSGSDIVWVQCQPCNQCYRQTDPVFNPAQSNTYSGVTCSSSVCGRLDNSRGCSHNGGCRYEVVYSDGSFTKGTLAMETLTVGGTTVTNVAIGCGHSNQGMFVGAAGLLGLGSGSMSFVGQLGGQTGGAFSYCLVSRGSGATGSLVFGREAMPEGAAWINLVRSPRAPSFYYVGLSGLGVGGVRVPVPDNIFELTESGDGGVVMDTGTAVTRLPAAAYVAFRDSFVTQTGNLPRAQGESIFDTCYNLGGFSSVRVPTVSFYFTDGPILTLPARNFLIPVDEAGTFCFAFAPSPSGLSIIGNIQQEGIQISIDGANGFVGFGPNTC